MSIVWEHWKVGMSREKCGGSSVVFIVLIVFLLVMGGFELPRGEMDWQRLFDAVRRHPSVLFLPLMWLAIVPWSCQLKVGELTQTTLSFCLPGLRESLRKLFFSFAVAFGLTFCLGWMLIGFEPGQSHGATNSVWTYAVLSALGSFLLGMAGSLAVSVLRFVLHPLAWGILALLSIPLGLIGFYCVLALCEYPFVAIPISATVLVFFWVRLGNMACVRRGHRAILDEAMDPRVLVGFKRPAPAWVDHLFLGRAEQCCPLGLGRHIWASFYRAFGSVLTYWKWILGGAVLASVALGLMPRSVVEVMFVCLGLGAATMNLPVTSSLLLPAGRRERFWGSVAAGIAMSFLLLVVAAIIGGVAEIVALRFGVGASDVGLRIASAWLACVLVPWTCAGRLGGSGVLRIASGSGVTLAWLFALVLCGQFFDFFALPTPRRYLVLASVLVCGWAVFVLTLRQGGARGCLVGSRMRDEG